VVQVMAGGWCAGGALYIMVASRIRASSVLGDHPAGGPGYPGGGLTCPGGGKVGSGSSDGVP